MTAFAPRFDLSRARDVAGAGSRRFWSTLEELVDEKGFRALLQAEFPEVSSMFDDPGRRQFLKLMGASLLLGGLSACSDNKSDYALPYVNQPEDVIPGVARYYATGVLFDGYVQPVVATTYAGRPTKLDGNPDHPAARGKSDAFAQTAIFQLYDPERSKVPLRGGVPSTWDVFANALVDMRARWRERGGEGLHVLLGPTTSPTLQRQIAALTSQFPKMHWSHLPPAGFARQDEAMRLAFGRPVVPHFRLGRCEVIVSLDHDLLGPGAHQVLHANAWAQHRGEVAPGQGRSRLHVAESVPSLTGTVASVRLASDPERIALLAQALGADFAVAGFARPDLQPAEQKWLERAVAELRAHGGHSLLTIGPQFDPSIQALAPLINEQLKNTNATVWYSDPIHLSAADAQPLATLTAEIEAGVVDTLIMIDCNPVYGSPGALKFADLVSRVGNRVHVGLHADETAQLCRWHLPLSHALEGWSDGRAVDGTATIIQPTVRPLYASRSVHQVFDLLAGANDPAADGAVRATWREAFGSAFEARWTRALHDGFVADNAARPVTLSPKAPPPPQSQSDEADRIKVVFQLDPTVWDGRFANIAWLQELPKPLTKITWDNVIAISPAIAERYKLSNGDIAEVTVDGRSVRGAVWVVPGQAARTVALYFGYGRRAGGDVAVGAGYDAFAVWPSETDWLARGAIARVPGNYAIATTQAHQRMDGFDLVR